MPRFGRAWLRSPNAVEEDGDGHVAEDVGCGPAAVQEPVDGWQNGDLLGGETHRGEYQGERDETAGGYATGAHAGNQSGQYDDHLVDETQRIAQRLGHEQRGRRLVERGAVVVEVGADACRQLARSSRVSGEGADFSRAPLRLASVLNPEAVPAATSVR